MYLPPSPEDKIAARFRGLLEAARAGNAEALGSLLEEFRPYLLRIAHDELGDSLRGELAPSDVVQTSFDEAVRAFPTFRGEKADSLRAWLRQILRNNVRDVTGRRRLPTEPIDGDRHAPADPGPSPSDNLRREELKRTLEAALSRLSREQRLVVEGRQIHDLTFVEIGARLGKSADAARKIWEGALVELRALLPQDSDGPFRPAP